MNILRIAWKDLKFLLRSRTTLIFSILMPVIMMIMTSYIFPQAGVDYNGKMGFFSEDPIIQTFSENMKNNDHIKLFKSRDKMIDALTNKEISIAAIIPKDFSVSSLTGNAKIEVIPSPSNPQQGMMVAQSIPNMISQMQNKQNTPNIKAELINVDGSEFNYYDFMAPGIMAMISIMSVMTGLAASITRERELGTMDGLMVTPINRGSIVLGKILAQTTRGVIQALIVLLISITIFNVTINGSILLTILILVIGTFSFIGIGIIVTSAFKEQETAQITMTAITFPMIFFSGVFFPVDQMPEFAKYVAKIFPLSYSADALRKVMVLGANIGQVSTELIVLSLFAIVTATISTLTFHKIIQD